MADLINDGNIGLIEAIQRFDEWKGVRLSTCATMIRQVKKRALRKLKGKIENKELKELLGIR